MYSLASSVLRYIWYIFIPYFCRFRQKTAVSYVASFRCRPAFHGYCPTFLTAISYGFELFLASTWFSVWPFPTTKDGFEFCSNNFLHNKPYRAAGTRRVESCDFTVLIGDPWFFFFALFWLASRVEWERWPLYLLCPTCRLRRLTFWGLIYLFIFPFISLLIFHNIYPSLCQLDQYGC